MNVTESEMGLPSACGPRLEDGGVFCGICADQAIFSGSCRVAAAPSPATLA
jgi:hypothetical protein